MRFSEYKIGCIKNLTQFHFGKDVQVYLFGSRTSDEKRGADIGLFIHKQNPAKSDFRSKIEFITDLIFKTEEQKIDIVPDGPALRK